MCPYCPIYVSDLQEFTKINFVTSRKINCEINKRAIKKKMVRVNVHIKDKRLARSKSWVYFSLVDLGLRLSGIVVHFLNNANIAKLKIE